jgi:hypothetical protein
LPGIFLALRLTGRAPGHEIGYDIGSLHGGGGGQLQIQLARGPLQPEEDGQLRGVGIIPGRNLIDGREIHVRG